MDAQKLFIAVPLEKEMDMTAVIQKQQQAALDLTMQTGKHYEVIDYIEADMFMVKPMVALGKALIAMADADVIAFLPNWQQSKICKVIRLCADGYGKRSIDMTEE